MNIQLRYQFFILCCSVSPSFPDKIHYMPAQLTKPLSLSYFLIHLARARSIGSLCHSRWKMSSLLNVSDCQLLFQRLSVIGDWNQPFPTNCMMPIKSLDKLPSNEPFSQNEIYTMLGDPTLKQVNSSLSIYLISLRIENCYGPSRVRFQNMKISVW